MIEIIKSASFNEDRKHRIWLKRNWDTSKPIAMIIGLNPSTANENLDDPTIKSLIRILTNNGFGGLIMTNLFTFVSADPSLLKNPANCDYDLRQCVKVWKVNFMKLECPATIIFAWGNFDTYGRDKKAISEFGQFAYCFGKNKNGSPKHPLYLKSDVKLERWISL